MDKLQDLSNVYNSVSNVKYEYAIKGLAELYDGTILFCLDNGDVGVYSIEKMQTVFKVNIFKDQAAIVNIAVVSINETTGQTLWIAQEKNGKVHLLSLDHVNMEMKEIDFHNTNFTGFIKFGANNLCFEEIGAKFDRKKWQTVSLEELKDDQVLIIYPSKENEDDQTFGVYSFQQKKLLGSYPLIKEYKNKHKSNSLAAFKYFELQRTTRKQSSFILFTTEEQSISLLAVHPNDKCEYLLSLFKFGKQEIPQFIFDIDVRVIKKTENGSEENIIFHIILMGQGDTIFVIFYSLTKNQVIGQMDVKIQSESEITAITNGILSTSGKYCYISCSDCSLQVFDFVKEKSVLSFKIHRKSIVQLAYLRISDRRELLVAAGEDGNIVFINLNVLHQNKAIK